MFTAWYRRFLDPRPRPRPLCNKIPSLVLSGQLGELGPHTSTVETS